MTITMVFLIELTKYDHNHDIKKQNNNRLNNDKNRNDDNDNDNDIRDNDMAHSDKDVSGNS